MIKGIAMAQWVNRLRNSIFVNPPPLPLSCEISGALHLAEPGLTAGRQAGRLAGWLADDLRVSFEIFKLSEFLLRLTKVQHHYGLTNAFQWVFSDTSLLEG